MIDSEARLRMAASAANAVLWTMDPVSGRMWMTDKAKSMFGLQSTEDFTLQRFMDLVHQEDRSSVQNVIEGALKSGEERSVEYRVNRPDAETRWILSRGCRCSGVLGEEYTLNGLSVDITENRRNEEAQRRHSAIVQSSDDAIIAMDLQGIIADWNAAAERIYGYSKEEAVGQNIAFYIPPELRSGEAMILNRLGAGESIQHSETVRVRKDGSRVSVSLTASPIRDSTGRIVGVSRIARDISEAKRVQKELQNSYCLGSA